MKTAVIKIKNEEKFNIKQDFDQEREYLVSIHFLSGENNLNKINPAILVIKSNLTNSKIISKIMVKSMQK